MDRYILYVIDFNSFPKYIDHLRFGGRNSPRAFIVSILTDSIVGYPFGASLSTEVNELGNSLGNMRLDKRTPQ